MFAALQRYIPLFENYIASKDKHSFIANTQDPIEKILLEILETPIDSLSSFRENLKRTNLSQQLKQEIETYKIYKYVQQANELKKDELFNGLSAQYGGGNFEYSKPAVLNTHESTEGAKDTKDSQLELPFTIEEYLQEKRKKSPSWIRQINDYGFSRVKDKIILELPLADKEYVLQKFTNIFHLPADIISKFLIRFQQQKKKTNISYTLPSKILSYLTKQQLLELSRVYPAMMNNQDYIQLWFNQKYAQIIRRNVQGSNFFTQRQQQEKRTDFRYIIQQLKQYKHTPIIKGYSNKLKSEVLILDTIVNDPDISRLVDYLESSHVILQLSNIREDYYSQFHNKVDQNHQEPKMRYKLQVDKTIPNQFIEEYIELLFRNGDGSSYIKQLERFFNESYLRKLNAKVRLYKGQLIRNTSDYFSQDQLQVMKDRKQIRILSTNSKNYKVKGEVKLDISIKNVKTINIKVYQLNLQKHLLSESANYSIDDQIQLSFLYPTFEERFQNKSTNPYQVIYTKLDLSKIIPEAMGVYIVDLQGETVTSRAVIRKGAIICVDTLTEAGQQFSFFDQQGRPLTKEQGLKVSIREKAAELTGNKAFVPYSDKSQYGSIVASIGNYAQAFQRQFQQQKYKFEVAYIYNNQSFIVGRKAKILLHARLSMNEKTMSLKLLKNTKVRVTVTNNQNIKTSYPFDIEKWSNSNDQAIEFPIQAYTKNISIYVDSSITLQNGKESNLSSFKQITIDLGQHSTNFLDLYLQKNNQEDYLLNVLGANGEPITNADVIITYSVIGVEQTERKQLKTNHEGRINLGPLNIVARLSAEVNNSETNIQRVWQIDQTQTNFNYNKTIHFKLGEKISLPVNPKWRGGDILLLRTFDKFCSQDLSDRIIFDYGRITLPTINQQGFYVLKMLPINKTIEIITLKNIRWEDDTVENQKVYDQDDGILYEITKNLYQTIAINNATFQSKQQHIKATISLDLGSVPQDRLNQVRVHVLANNFVSAEIGDTFKVGDFNVQGKLNEHYLQIKRSAYYSNKNSSDQGAYVWNRQAKNEQLVGNNLQKPSIFLKRTLVRETNETKENLNDEGRYDEECAMMDIDPNMRQRFRASNADSKSKISITKNTLNLNSHNNFLLLSTGVINNLNGKSIQLQIPHGYNSIDVFVLTPKTAIKNTYALPSKLDSKKKDLRHSGLQDCQQNTGWTMSREISKVSAGQKRVVNRDSQWRTVGLVDIFQFASTKRIKLYDWSSHLLNWHNLDDNKKRQIYDKESCHELNTFIKFKDEKFFNDVVRKFIRNKIDRTIVDLCLLDDPSASSYASLNKFQRLNAFQKALLVYNLVQNGKSDVAKSIVEALQLQQKSIKRNYQEDKNNFDTIINAKETEQKTEIRREKRMMQQKVMMLKRSAPKMAMREMRVSMAQREEVEQVYMSRRMDSMQIKKAFVAVESTKEYTQKTYLNVKDYRLQAPNLVKPSLFWAELARSFLQAKPLLSSSFMYFKTPVEFVLASSFISSQSSSNFELSNADNKYEILVKSPMLIYIKEVKRVEHAKKFGVLINQRFFDPNNRIAYEQDGTEYQKQVQEFIIKKSYICQTVINNTSGTPLQLQVLLDIPKGTIPLRSHQYTQIINIRIEPYSSKSYERYFYIPQEGQYSIYPSNASRGSSIIAKASALPPIVVKKVWTVNKLQSFEDVIRSGKEDQVINFLQSRNIFDENVFKPSEILWMLKDKNFYFKVIQVLKRRSFYNRDIWRFGFLHNDIVIIKQIINFSEPNTLYPTAFEYFPYYSTRTHPFANQNKSTIRNVQFKQTYIRFLLGSIIGLRTQSFKVSHCYFLILQDRLKEASNIIKEVNEQEYKTYQIQYDYMRCFLDLSLNSLNFNDARQITKKYKEYPIESWRKLFNEVSKTIQMQDEFFDENEVSSGEVFQTQVIQQGAQIKVIQPANTLISVQIFEINLQLYFSEYPFYEIKSFTSIKPSKTILLQKNAQTKETIIKRSDYKELKDSTVEITQIKDGVLKKITSFWWVNPEVKVKFNENQGTLQVFLDRKRSAGAYVKVFSDKGINKDFYRDGYTDMTGTFRYAMSDLDGIKEFSILVMTERGGVIQKVKPPSKLASY